jgi:hypothetical protein
LPARGGGKQGLFCGVKREEGKRWWQKQANKIKNDKRRNPINYEFHI